MKRRLRKAGSVADGRKKLCKARSFLASTGEKKYRARRSEGALTLKDVLDTIDTGCLAFLDNHFDDIKSPGDVAGLQQLQPGIGAAFDQLLFGMVDSIERSTHAPGTAGFHLDEQQQFPASGDNVNLSSLGRAVVPIEDFFATAAQPVAGHAFAEFADLIAAPRLAIVMVQTTG